ncbi:Protein CBG00481 [Caenorhabditis briggsae]|uniref:Protein CBG00481 n=1 Tax=Caenorhabditis briggsae TaxID=6238 RepID=A8WMR7_CAEBR|nr:Protein CBG00481 [Caenorhabditis briggsae]CAP21772.2 Protein CBG00481 [Caenorhabditis briggsae]
MADAPAPPPESPTTLNNLVTGQGLDAEKAAKSSIPINNIDGATLEKNGMEFLKALKDEDLGKLVLAANYLETKKLLRYCCKKMAMMAQGKAPLELRILFEISTDEEDEHAEMGLKERHRVAPSRKK